MIITENEDGTTAKTVRDENTIP